MSIATQDRPIPGGPETLWGRVEVAAYFKVTAQTVKRWEAADKLPKPVRLGRRFLWRPETIREFVAGREAP